MFPCRVFIVYRIMSSPVNVGQGSNVNPMKTTPRLLTRHSLLIHKGSLDHYHRRTTYGSLNNLLVYDFLAATSSLLHQRFILVRVAVDPELIPGTLGHQSIHSSHSCQLSTIIRRLTTTTSKTTTSFLNCYSCSEESAIHTDAHDWLDCCDWQGLSPPTRFACWHIIRIQTHDLLTIERTLLEAYD